MEFSENIFFFFYGITPGSLPPLVKPELLQQEPCKSPVNQSNHSMDAKEYFDHNTAQPGPDNLSLGLFFKWSSLATKSRNIARTQGNKPRLLEENAFLLLNCTWVLDFRTWAGPTVSFPKLRDLQRGKCSETSMEKSLYHLVPLTQIHRANKWDGDHPTRLAPSPNSKTIKVRQWHCHRHSISCEFEQNRKPR